MRYMQSIGVTAKPKARSKEIDNQLQRDKLVATNEIKILLLEAGESGKATFLKKLIHHDGYSDSERDSYKEIIFSHTVQSMRAILDSMQHLNLTLAPQNAAHRATILSLPSRIQADFLPRDVGHAIRELWCDPSVQEAVKCSRQFQLIDSAVYYFNAIKHISSPFYLPTDEDIFRSPTKTIGITETKFKFGKLTCKLFDISGQRGKLRKWIHCFENVTALVFLVSLNLYDQMSSEDETMNCMQEALILFDAICSSRWSRKKPIILFFNEIDLFLKKLPHSPLQDYFPDYHGANQNAAREYLRRRFVNLKRDRQIYWYYTYATDTQQNKFLLDAIQNIRRRQYLLESDVV